MILFSFNENMLTRLICEAHHHIEVFDGKKSYYIPFKSALPRSSNHFVAQLIDSQKEVVLAYRNIQKINIDHKVLNCL